MTTTTPEITYVAEPVPPSAPLKRSHAVAIVAAAVAVVAAAAIAVTAFGSHAPQTATQVVAGAGYTVVQTYTPATMPASLSAYATSAAYGVSGGDAEIVVVFKPADDGLGGAVVPVLQSDLPGLSVTMSGGDLTVTGPETVFVSDTGAAGF
jgi:hypothetical protein